MVIADVSRYHLPTHIKKHVDYITPGLRLLSGSKRAQREGLTRRGFKTGAAQNFSSPLIKGPAASGLADAAAAGCDSQVIPSCIASKLDQSFSSRFFTY